MSTRSHPEPDPAVLAGLDDLEQRWSPEAVLPPVPEDLVVVDDAFLARSAVSGSSSCWR